MRVYVGCRAAFVVGTAGVFIGSFLPLFTVKSYPEHRDYSLIGLSDAGVPAIPVLIGGLAVLFLVGCLLSESFAGALPVVVGLTVVETVGVLVVGGIGFVLASTIKASSDWDSGARDVAFHPGMWVVIVGLGVMLTGAIGWWLRRAVDSCSE